MPQVSETEAMELSEKISAAGVDSRKEGTLTWKDKPTTSGWYWFRREGSSFSTMTWVDRDMRCCEGGHYTKFKGEWKGPLSSEDGGQVIPITIKPEGSAGTTKQIIQAAAQVLLDAALNALQKDPHGWSERPCETCRFVGSVVGRPFGCYVYAEQKRERNAKKA